MGYKGNHMKISCICIAIYSNFWCEILKLLIKCLCLHASLTPLPNGVEHI